jgi:hypothetical protein
LPLKLLWLIGFDSDTPAQIEQARTSQKEGKILTIHEKTLWEDPNSTPWMPVSALAIRLTSATEPFLRRLSVRAYPPRKRQAAWCVCGRGAYICLRLREGVPHRQSMSAVVWLCQTSVLRA